MLELNSRTYCERIAQIDRNAEALCDYLRAEGSTVIAKLNYPKWQTRELYDACRSKFASGEGGFGGLFSIIFVEPAAAHAFFDALDFAFAFCVFFSFAARASFFVSWVRDRSSRSRMAFLARAKTSSGSWPRSDARRSSAMGGREVVLVLGRREEGFSVCLFVERVEEGAVYKFLVERPWQKGRMCGY